MIYQGRCQLHTLWVYAGGIHLPQRKNSCPAMLKTHTYVCATLFLHYTYNVANATIIIFITQVELRFAHDRIDPGVTVSPCKQTGQQRSLARRARASSATYSSRTHSTPTKHALRSLLCNWSCLNHIVAKQDAKDVARKAAHLSKAQSALGWEGGSIDQLYADWEKLEQISQPSPHKVHPYMNLSFLSVRTPTRADILFIPSLFGMGLWVSRTYFKECSVSCHLDFVVSWLPWNRTGIQDAQFWVTNHRSNYLHNTALGYILLKT